MAEMRSRPYVDWSQFSRQNFTEPVIYLKHEPVDEAYEMFRRLSHKVAKCRYDIPFGHSVIVAYSHRPRCPEPPQAVGIITFKLADGGAECFGTEKVNFMDDYVHQISFLFVDQMHQRKGIGRSLMNEALKTIRESGLERAVHLEAAKSAVKFFRKVGFTIRHSSKGESVSTWRGSRLFRNCALMEHRL